MGMSHIEDALQKAVVDAARLFKINRPSCASHGHMLIDFLFAIPNGGKRDAREAARFKAQGVKAGVPDLFLCIGTRDYHGLFVELKRPKCGTQQKGRLSANQKEMIARLEAQHYFCSVSYSVDEVVAKFKWYLALP